MKLSVQTFTVQKKFALKISRGTTDRTTNLWLRIREDDLEGWGEARYSPIKTRNYGN
jgi:L-Ala-D/L-Glu epimerase